MAAHPINGCDCEVVSRRPLVPVQALCGAELAGLFTKKEHRRNQAAEPRAQGIRDASQGATVCISGHDLWQKQKHLADPPDGKMPRVSSTLLNDPCCTPSVLLGQQSEDWRISLKPGQPLFTHTHILAIGWGHVGGEVSLSAPILRQLEEEGLLQ